MKKLETTIEETVGYNVVRFNEKTQETFGTFFVGREAAVSKYQECCMKDYDWVIMKDVTREREIITNIPDVAEEYYFAFVPTDSFGEEKRPTLFMDGEEECKKARDNYVKKGVRCGPIKLLREEF